MSKRQRGMKSATKIRASAFMIAPIVDVFLDSISAVIGNLQGILPLAGSELGQLGVLFGMSSGMAEVWLRLRRYMTAHVDDVPDKQASDRRSRNPVEESDHVASTNLDASAIANTTDLTKPITRRAAARNVPNAHASPPSAYRDEKTMASATPGFPTTYSGKSVSVTTPVRTGKDAP